MTVSQQVKSSRWDKVNIQCVSFHRSGTCSYI